MLTRLTSTFASLLILCVTTVAQASLFGQSGSSQPLQVDQAFVLDASQTQPDRVELIWTIAPDYYLYQSKIELTPPSGVAILSREDSPTDTKDDPLFGQVEVFHDRAEVRLLLARTGPEVPDSGVLKIRYQGCWEGGICYPPVDQQLNLTQLTTQSAVADRAVSPAPPAAKPQISTAADAPLSEQDQFFETLSKASLMTLLGVFFLAGLALSLTPCVFPMIPILSGIIAGQGHRVNTRKGLALSLVYVLAMAATYTLAGVAAGLFGANLQVALQIPWVIALFSLIFVALALSMFGFYNLQFPAAFQTWLTRGSERRQGGTYAGVAVMGFLSALIVGPCMAAPLAGALIYIGQTGDPMIGGLALFSMSIGMGVPLILIGTSAARIMPRAGAWMETVKAGFGVVLLLMAVWMLDRIVPVEVTMGLVALILIPTSVYMGAVDPLGEGRRGVHKLSKGLGLVLLIYAVFLVAGLLSGGKSLVYPLKGLIASQAAEVDEPKFVTITRVDQLEQILATAQQNGTPVLLDYYADWCVSCAELDYVTFADPAVRQRMRRLQLVKVDVTANDDEAKALTARYAILGPPTLVFYDTEGRYRKELTLVGVPTPEQFLSSAERL